MPLDDGLREAMVRSRTGMLEAQTEAERAQVRFHRAVREAHAAGGSLREIAAVLDMSHQRVHQIVDPDSGKAGLRDPSRRKGRGLLKCSFCGAAQGDVAKLIAGPGVYICDRCLAQVNEIIHTGGGTRTSVSTKCSFCGKRRKQVKALVSGPGVYICNECVDLCNEIVGEELGS